MKTRNLILTVALGAFYLGACGGDDGVALPDARPMIDAPAAQCLADADYGTPTFVATQVVGNNNMDGTPGFLDGLGQLNADADVLAIQLYDSYGVFTNGIATGTFDITGQELNYATCGVCVRLFSEDTNDTGGYLATGGTVTVTAFGPVGGNFDVSVDNITFQHVVVDPNTFESTPHADGCTTALTHAQVAGTIEQAM